MKFKIRNKNYLENQSQSPDFAFILLHYISNLVGLFTVSIIIMAATRLVTDSILILLIEFILMSIILPVVITFLTKNKAFEAFYDVRDIDETLQNDLNKIYVSKNDHEQIYFLHELIINHGIENSKHDQSNEINIELNLKESDNKYYQFDEENYDSDQIDVFKEVIKYRKMSIEKASQFYDKFIDQYTRPVVRSIEERNELKQRIINKNM